MILTFKVESQLKKRKKENIYVPNSVNKKSEFNFYYNKSSLSTIVKLNFKAHPLKS